jgi:hypothetical protein
MFKHPTVEAQYESVSKVLRAEVLGCLSLLTVVWDVVDIGPCCHLFSVLEHKV